MLPQSGSAAAGLAAASGAGCPPDAEIDVWCSVQEVAVGGEQRVVVADGELGDECVDGPDLHTGSATGIAELGGGDVVIPVGAYQGEVAESCDDLGAGSVGNEPLQQFLEDQAGRDDEVVTGKGAEQFVDFGGFTRLVAAEGE
ncbi:MAG: hypothetical protein L0H41_00620 [Microlunatus sp.]|nr:hypothetical protein [Microlunatus sp.]MDN5769942.1 hypothetical protein [Microlunatus sp.]